VGRRVAEREDLVAGDGQHVVAARDDGAERPALAVAHPAGGLAHRELEEAGVPCVHAALR
jgi:hypothetical protein